MITRMTHDQIVPEQYQHLLMSAGESISQSCWMIGDITNMLCDQALKTNSPVSKSEIWAAVAHFCGKGVSSVRRYAAIAEFYPKEIRQKYNELSFSHFTFASQFRNQDGWVEVLETALDGMLSVSALKAKYSFNPPQPPSIPVDPQIESRSKIHFELPNYEPPETNTRPDIQTRVAYNAVVNLRRILYALPVDRQQVDAAISILTGLIQEVHKSLIDESVSLDV